MGGAVSSGRDNDELVDNLMVGNYIRTRAVERVFRALDRADFMPPHDRDSAYKDLAWRNGPLHLSAPCIYSEVLEALELKPGLSFLNIGSGTGYLSTMVGLILGSSGISHGVEALPVVTEYANTHLGLFMEHCVTLDEFDFCVPKYYTGNGLCLAPSQTYDRVYCGAGVLPKYENYFKQLTKVGGVLVMPLADTLVQMHRVSVTHWTKRNLLNVSFAVLKEPLKEDLKELIRLEEQTPPPLQLLSRAVIRRAMQSGLCRRHPELREPPPRQLPHRNQPRRIHIPIEADSDEELQALHGLDEASGAHEMNALLSLVLSMGQSRAAGSLRLDRLDRADDSDRESDDSDVVQLDDFDAEAYARADGDVIVVGVGARRPPAPPAPSTSRGPLTRSKAARMKTETESAKAKTEAETSQSRPVTRSTTAKNKTSKTKTETKSGTGTESDASPKSSRSGDSDSPRIGPLLYDEDSSSADEETQMQESKRQKLDSGIGEPTTSSGSPGKSDDTDDGRSRRSSRDRSSAQDDTDVGWEDMSSGSECECSRRKGPRRHKRARAPARSRSHSEGPGKKSDERRRLRPRTHARTGSSDSGEGGSTRLSRDARRVRLSLAMKRGVRELPLPHQLIQWVNLGRCYDF